MKVMFALVAGLTLLRSNSLAQELRTWSDSTGKQKLEGRYLGMTGTMVTLELKTGKTIDIELKKFSKKDQKYIRAINDDDSATGEAPSDPAGRNDEAMESERAETFSVDWRDAEAILPARPEKWKATVAPSSGFGIKPRTVVLPPKKNFHEGITGIAANSIARKAVVCYRLGSTEEDSTLRLVMCDLQTGKTVGIAETQALMAPIAMHDDGQQVLMRHDGFGHGNNEVLELWTIDGKKIQKKLSWTPYIGSFREKLNVIWAEFVDADHLLTCSAEGKVVFWEYAKAEPLWYFETETGATPCLSGDRRTIGFCDRDNIGLMDIASRTVIGMVAVPEKQWGKQLAFSPSGRRMACITTQFGTLAHRVMVWDTTNGQKIHDFEVTGLLLVGKTSFPDDNFLLAADSFIIDLENQLKLWQYTGAEKLVQAGNMTLAAVGSYKGPGALLSLELPHNDARDLLKKAVNYPDLFVFREGVTVKLDVAGVPAADQVHVRETLTQKLKEMNCNVAENGTISLVATVSGPKERTISYMRAGEFTVQEYLTELSFVYQGTKAWFGTHSNIPYSLSLKSGEDPDGVLRKASAKPDLSYYDGVVLPSFLQKPTAGQEAAGLPTLGRSEFTPSGLK